MSGDPESSSLWATIGVGAAVVGLTIATPLATVAAPVVMAALIIEGSSTNPTGEGIKNFLQGKFNGTPLREVNFRTGPFGIWRALAEGQPANTGDPGHTSPGWDAAKADLLISYLKATDPNSGLLANTTWVPVSDRDVAAADGSSGNRYPEAPLSGGDPVLRPPVDGGTGISTTYQYDLNGNVPAYLLNPIADTNSLVAYINRRLAQDDLPMPVAADGTIFAPDGTEIHCETTCIGVYQDANGKGVTVRITEVNGVTYVHYETSGLPLVQPLRDYFGEPGNQVADALEPGLTALVNYGYRDNNPQADPGTSNRVGLLPTPAETQKFVQEFAEGIQAGADSLNRDAGHATAEFSQAVAPLRQSIKRELNRVQAQINSSINTPAKRALQPPKPTPISAKAAADRLTKVFTPKKPSSLNRVTRRSEKAANATP